MYTQAEVFSITCMCFHREAKDHYAYVAVLEPCPNEGARAPNNEGKTRVDSTKHEYRIFALLEALEHVHIRVRGTGLATD